MRSLYTTNFAAEGLGIGAAEATSAPAFDDVNEHIIEAVVRNCEEWIARGSDVDEVIAAMHQQADVLETIRHDGVDYEMDAAEVERRIRMDYDNGTIIGNEDNDCYEQIAEAIQNRLAKLSGNTDDDPAPLSEDFSGDDDDDDGYDEEEEEEDDDEDSNIGDGIPNSDSNFIDPDRTE